MTDVWLEHVGLGGEDGHGGKFLCPAAAVAAWRAMGWEPAAEPPEEPNPVVAENVAAQLAAAEEAGQDAGQETERKKPKKSGGSARDTTSSSGKEA